MIHKGIVESVSDMSIVVRIPDLDKSKSAVGSVNTGLLGSACICTLPGISVQLQRGDIVFVDFEDTLNEAPVILGTLYGFGSTSKCNITPMELNVSVLCRLPKDTEIGDIKYSHLNKLTGITYNIQHKFDELIRENEKLKEEIDSINSKLNLLLSSR